MEYEGSNNGVVPCAAVPQRFRMRAVASFQDAIAAWEAPVRLTGLTRRRTCPRGGLI